jgi:hypothetical protein
MRTLLVLTSLCLVGVLVLAPVAFAQDLDCEDFATQEQAQRALERNQSDPHNLDDDDGADDGIACESLVSGGSSPTATPSATPSASPDVTVQEGPPLTVATPTSDTATPIASGAAPAPAASAAGGTLPATGGDGFALMAAALLVGSGVMTYAILRRK